MASPIPALVRMQNTIHAESNGKGDYYEFKIPYWDWHTEKQTEEILPLRLTVLERLCLTIVAG